jgi:CDP-diacylglycerol--glycerol-3-phosphate 3-phosphatidyltransferase
MLNLPNALTFLRILLAPVLVVVLLTRFDGSELWGLGIFLLAAITDAVDGAIARRTQSVTNVGALLDPIADKLLISSAYISLAELGLAPAWMVVVIVGRDFAVSGLRQIAQERGVTIAATMWGKLKTLSQIIAFSVVIVTSQLAFLEPLGTLALWVAVAMTAASLASYFIRFWHQALGTAP